MNGNLTLDDMLENLDRKRIKVSDSKTNTANKIPKIRHTLNALNVPHNNDLRPLGSAVPSQKSLIEDQVNCSEKAFRNDKINVLNVRQMKMLGKSASNISKRSVSVPVNFQSHNRSHLNVNVEKDQSGTSKTSNYIERKNSTFSRNSQKTLNSERSSTFSPQKQQNQNQVPFSKQNSRRESISLHSRASRRGSILNAFGTSTIEKEHSHAMSLEKRRNSIIGKVIKNLPEADDTTYDDTACIEEQNKAALEDIEPLVNDDDQISNSYIFEEYEEFGHFVNRDQSQNSQLYTDNFDAHYVSSAEYVSDFPQVDKIMSSRNSNKSRNSSAIGRHPSYSMSKSSHRSGTNSKRTTSEKSLIGRAKLLARQVQKDFIGQRTDKAQRSNTNNFSEENLDNNEKNSSLFDCCGLEHLRLKTGGKVHESPQRIDS